MWFGIGKMCLEKKYNQNINVPNNYARGVQCKAIQYLHPLYLNNYFYFDSISLSINSIIKRWELAERETDKVYCKTFQRASKAKCVEISLSLFTVFIQVMWFIRRWVFLKREMINLDN